MRARPAGVPTGGTLLFRWRSGYALAAALLLVVEVVIALFVRDGLVRPYLGDVLAVALVACALRAVLGVGSLPAALAAFGIAAMIEFGQYWRVLRMVGLEDDPLARTILGSGFDRVDFLAYAAGALCIIVVDRLWKRSKD